MGNVSVRHSTPIGAVSLCATCSNSHVIEGFRESEVIALCTYIYDRPISIQFRVKSCSNYHDKTRPSYRDMQKLAIPVTTGTLKPVGFLLEREREKDSEETECEDQ